jgi:pSer/pThr/pTyr-binding forkhead associated (FHA) protein
VQIDAWLYLDPPTFKSFRLGSSQKIGRDAACEICLDDGKVSRVHARIDLSGGAFVLYDLSRNGVALNGRRMGKPTALSQDDKIQLGDTRLTFTFQPPRQLEVEDTVKRPDPDEVAAAAEARAEADRQLVEQLVTMLDRLMEAWSLRRAVVLARSTESSEQEVFVGRPEGLDQITDIDREYIATASGGHTVNKLLGMKSGKSVAAGVETDYPFGVLCMPLGDEEVRGILYLEISESSPEELRHEGQSKTLSVLIASLTEALARRSSGSRTP